MYKQGWLELGPNHLYSCNDRTTNCWKLKYQLRSATQGVENSWQICFAFNFIESIYRIINFSINCYKL